MIIWLTYTDVAIILSTPGNFFASIGKAAALMGVAVYALMPVLSMRNKYIEAIFGGLDVVYYLHRKSGILVLALFIAHPIFLGLGRMLNGASLATIWNWASALIIIGVLALLMVVVLSLVAIYSHIKHQKWIKIHRILGWVGILIVIHVILADSKIIQIKPLTGYLFALCLVGFLSFLYRTYYRIFVTRYPYSVCEINNQNDSVVEIVLKPLRAPIIYQPGQFAFMSIINSKVIDSEPHPYSFTTANNGPYVRFAIKKLGDDTSKIQNIEPGSLALLEGPYGKFSMNQSKNQNQVWLAGGVGITPFLSMARSLSNDTSLSINLFYAVDKSTDAVFLKEITMICQSLPQVFNLHLIDKESTGFISIELLESTLENLSQNDYFICGPPSMMNSLTKGLLSKNVPRKNIYFEDFSIH